MILPLYRRLTDEDFQDAPKGNWKSKLLYAINLYFQQLYYGLQNQLTPEQNDVCQVKTFSITGSSTPANNTYRFSALFPYQPSRMTLGKIVPTDGSSLVFTAAPFISWSFSNGTFNVLGICGLADGVPYTITIEVRWPPLINA